MKSNKETDNLKKSTKLLYHSIPGCLQSYTVLEHMYCPRQLEETLNHETSLNKHEKTYNRIQFETNHIKMQDMVQNFTTPSQSMSQKWNHWEVKKISEMNESKNETNQLDVRYL